MPRGNSNRNADLFLAVRRLQRMVEREAARSGRRAAALKRRCVPGAPPAAWEAWREESGYAACHRAFASQLKALVEAERRRREAELLPPL